MLPALQFRLELLLAVLECDALAEVGSGRVLRRSRLCVVEVLEPVVEAVVGVLKKHKQCSVLLKRRRFNFGSCLRGRLSSRGIRALRSLVQQEECSFQSEELEKINFHTN